MANQPQQLPPPRTYTRTDFTALRAFVQRLPAATIARLYYDPQRSPHAASADATGRFLGTMRDDLVHLAVLHGSSVLAHHLKTSIKQHGSAKLTAMTLRMVQQASTLAAVVPLATHPVHLWFRPLITQRLNGEGIGTLGGLIEYCNARGGSGCARYADRSRSSRSWDTRRCRPRRSMSGPNGAACSTLRRVTTPTMRHRATISLVREREFDALTVSDCSREIVRVVAWIDQHGGPLIHPRLTVRGNRSAASQSCICRPRASSCL
ncbi:MULTISPECIES: phage integrase family protein [unclassified Caballeronia]|uniref:phage integrase family protein n=1 Tax=unclassified Caballeronia TaxID=2646786 RepID=UPI0020278D11|nr:MULTISPECIES: phage integrase family protein [unclassified Caballeronia]